VAIHGLSVVPASGANVELLPAGPEARAAPPLAADDKTHQGPMNFKVTQISGGRHLEDIANPGSSVPVLKQSTAWRQQISCFLERLHNAYHRRRQIRPLRGAGPTVITTPPNPAFAVEELSQRAS
jgi:hypothetical protein